MKKFLSVGMTTLGIALLSACGGGSSSTSEPALTTPESAVQAIYQAIVLASLDSSDISVAEPFYYAFTGTSGSTSLECDSGQASAFEDNQNNVELTASRCHQDFSTETAEIFFEYHGTAILDCDTVDTANTDYCMEGTITFSDYQEIIKDEDFDSKDEKFYSEVTLNFSGSADVDLRTFPEIFTHKGAVDRVLKDSSQTVRTVSRYNNLAVELEPTENGYELSLDGDATFSIAGAPNCAEVGKISITTLSQIVVLDDEEKDDVATAGSARITQGSTTARIDFNANGSADVTMNGRVTRFSESEIAGFCN